MIEKITSEEALNIYLNKTYGTTSRDYVHKLKEFSWGKEVEFSWWAKREAARFAHNAYKTTETLEYLNKLFPIFAHISLDDPKMVAFTPDAQCGENDKQIRISIGKLISKYLPVITQKHLQKMITDHESELNPEILWASGEELTEIYKNEMGNLGACMSKNTWNVHPTVAYHTEEIKLAYLKKDNKIVARTLVYEPKDGSKKVFIRMYPKGHALEKHLNNLGYEAGTFVGAKLNTVNIKEDKYAIPYLDGNNTSASSGYSYTALIDNQLTVIDPKTTEAIGALYGLHHNRYVSYTAEGWARYTNISSSEFNRACVLSNKEYSLLDCLETTLVWINNSVEIALKESIPNNWVEARTLNSNKLVFVDPTYVKQVGYRNIIATKEQLLELGYANLSKKYYPDASEKQFDKYAKTYDGEYIKGGDGVKVYSYDGKTVETKEYHHSEIKPRQFTKLHNNLLCTKDSKYLVTTSGKKVIPDLHDFYTLIDGTHTLRRPKARSYLYDREYFANTREELVEYLKTNEEVHFKKYFLDLLKHSSKSNIVYELTNYGCAARKYVNLSSLFLPEFLSLLYHSMELGSVKRKVVVNYLAEITAIEY